MCHALRLAICLPFATSRTLPAWWDFLRVSTVVAATSLLLSHLIEKPVFWVQLGRLRTNLVKALPQVQLVVPEGVVEIGHGLAEAGDDAAAPGIDRMTSLGWYEVIGRGRGH